MRSSYTFGGWFTGENGTGDQFTYDIRVNASVTVYAKWTYSGGNGDDDNGDDGNDGNDNGGGSSSGGADTTSSAPGDDTNSPVIPVASLSTNSPQGQLTFDTDMCSITVPSNMLTGVDGIDADNAKISIGQGDKTSLPDGVKATIGDKPLISLSLYLDGKQTDWSNPNAPVTVSIPYVPTAEELEHPECIVVWYIDGSGNVVTVPNGHYDPATGTVVFSTTHFSYYAVVSNTVSFADVDDTAWYAAAVAFCAARGITTGVENGLFAPENAPTRGQFIVMLMRAYGIEAGEDISDNFSDAGNTYYTGYLATAKRLDITKGMGNNIFAPKKAVTRQEMFTLLYNALKAIGQLPEGDAGKTLSAYRDSGEIDTWAADAMTLLVETGTVGGSGGKLMPKDTTSRAELAQVLYNLLSK